jgi:hypothetical protein
MAEAIETGVANVQFLSRIPVAGRADVEEELWDFEYGPGKWATVRRVVPSGRVGSMPTEIRWAE